MPHVITVNSEILVRPSGVFCYLGRGYLLKTTTIDTPNHNHACLRSTLSALGSIPSAWFTDGLSLNESCKVLAVL